jgi:hypothetical protein
LSDEKIPENTFEQLYLKERKKATIFMVAAIALAVLSAGLLVHTFSNGTKNTVGADGTMRLGDGNGAPMMQFDIKSFFKEDGGVDQDKVDEMKSRIPEDSSRLSDFIGPGIDTAVEDGEITSEQAAALKTALGITES